MFQEVAGGDAVELGQLRRRTKGRSGGRTASMVTEWIASFNPVAEGFMVATDFRDHWDKLSLA